MRPTLEGGSGSAESWLTVFLLWGAGICAAMQFSKISIGFVQFQRLLQVDAAHVSALMGAAGFFGLVFGVCGADFTRRFGFRRILIWSLISASLLSFVQMAMPPFPIFYVLRLLEGASNLFIVIAAPTLIVQIAPIRKIALAMGLWGTFYDVAFAVTGVFGPAIIKTGSITTLLLVHGTISLALAAALRTRPLGIESDLQNIVPKSIRNLVTQMAIANVNAYRRSTTALPGMMFFVISALYLGFVLFVPLSSPDADTANLLSITLPVVSIFGALLAGPLGQTKFGPARSLAVGFPLLGALAVALYVALIQMGNIVVYGVIANAMIFISGILQGSVFVLAAQLASRAQDEAVAFGVIAQLGSLGSIVGPVAFALIIQEYGFAGFMTLVGTAAILVSPIAFASVRVLMGSSPSEAGVGVDVLP